LKTKKESNYRAYKYRIYPNKEQENLFAQHFGCTRFVYNWALKKKTEAYEKDKTNLSIFSLKSEMAKTLKKEYTWLTDVNSQSLQASLLNLDTAFKKFFKKEVAFPKFKSKKKNINSFQVPQHTSINFENQKLNLPKIKNIKIILHRQFDGVIKTVTIKKTPTNKYFASILVENNQVKPAKEDIKLETTIGIDVGIKHFATFSNGQKIDNPRTLKKHEPRLKVLQKRLSRKQKGSNNRVKARLKVALKHEKITNIRQDFLHKTSHKLTHDNQVSSVAREDLAISNMLKNHKLAKAITDVSWSKFYEFLAYKCNWNGKNELIIGRFEASSKLCSVCNYKNQDLTLTTRDWQCPICNSKHDRDVNAAVNIRNFAINNYKTRQELPEELGELSTIVEAMNQEAFAFRQG